MKGKKRRESEAERLLMRNSSGAISYTECGSPCYITLLLHYLVYTLPSITTCSYLLWFSLLYHIVTSLPGTHTSLHYRVLLSTANWVQKLGDDATEKCNWKLVNELPLTLYLVCGSFLVARCSSHHLHVRNKGNI